MINVLQSKNAINIFSSKYRPYLNGIMNIENEETRNKGYDKIRTGRLKCTTTGTRQCQNQSKQFNNKKCSLRGYKKKQIISLTRRIIHQDKNKVAHKEVSQSSN